MTDFPVDDPSFAYQAPGQPNAYGPSIADLLNRIGQTGAGGGVGRVYPPGSWMAPPGSTYRSPNLGPIPLSRQRAPVLRDEET